MKIPRYNVTAGHRFGSYHYVLSHYLLKITFGSAITSLHQFVVVFGFNFFGFLLELPQTEEITVSRFLCGHWLYRETVTLQELHAALNGSYVSPKDSSV